MDKELHTLLARTGRDLVLARDELRLAYRALDEAASKEKGALARKRVRTAQEALCASLACYQALRQVESLDLP